MLNNPEGQPSPFVKQAGQTYSGDDQCKFTFGEKSSVCRVSQHSLFIIENGNYESRDIHYQYYCSEFDTTDWNTSDTDVIGFLSIASLYVWCHTYLYFSVSESVSWYRQYHSVRSRGKSLIYR